MSRIRSNFLFTALVWLITAAVASASSYTLEQQREDFQQAREALKKGHTLTFKKLLSKLSDYSLSGYLEYDFLRKRLHNESDDTVRDFLKRNDDSPISDRLRAAWLYTLAKQERWDTFLKEYREGSGSKVRCYYGQALFATGRSEEAMAVADELWLVGNSQPTQCDAVFEAWRAKGGMTRDMIWQRIRLAMENGRLSLAVFLAKSLDEEDRKRADLWRQVYRDPADTLSREELQVDTPIARRIVRHGIKRLARRDAGAAMAVWETVRPQHTAADQLDEMAEVAEVDRYVALKGVYQQHPQALEWLARLQNPDRQVRTWRVRAALARRDWWSALTWIEAMPAEERNDPQWRYWRARILEMQSLTLPVLRTAAERLYASLTSDRGYHGFLAADRLGVDYDFQSDPLQPNEAALEQLAKRPGIVRAYELYQLGIYADARREWNYATSTMSDEELQLASVLASRWGWHDRAILTVAKTEHWDDLELRFPVPFLDQVTKQSGKQGIDPAWVYGVLRQESVFMVDARSHAGALGLMQIMPRTGRLAARMLNSRLRSRWELLDADKNIRYGVAYLKRMLDANNGHQVLATASYNAGPQRVKQWMPGEPTEADLWVETLPFTETRRYVRRVMAYTVIFDHRLNGEVEPMRTRMPVILPESS